MKWWWKGNEPWFRFIFLVSWTRKHLLDIESLTPDEIVTVLDTARAFNTPGPQLSTVPELAPRECQN